MYAATLPVRLAPGRIVPGTNYEIVRWLGEGGMGVIYEARHTDVQRRVALKVLREDRCHPEAGAKLRQEAKTASSIGSEYIVEVYDLGELPDGRLYVALELIKGHDLFEELAHAPMPLTRLVPILRQVAKGLHAAHAAGVVHRDIKPENVLITRRHGRADAVKIVDFGISRVGGSSGGGEGRAIGTPTYMAPERWTGDAFEGPSVDLYAVGCLAIELLAGRPPFVGSLEEIMLAHFEHPVPALAELRPGLDVPAPLEAVIRRCLAKLPEERFASMADFEAALCEAQIAIGLETPWDDLPLPEVDDARRDALLRGMPGNEIKLVRNSPGRGVAWLLGAAVLLGLGGLAIPSGSTTEPIATSVPSEVELLAQRAKDAAARASFVYPPVDGDQETAYRYVLALEARDDAASRERAEALRTEFAATLSRLGDRYWERDGGRPFAADYYAQALVFLPDDEHAGSRAPLTPGELATLRAKAAALDFSAAERRVLTPLVLLAHDDESAALGALQAYVARAADVRSFSRHRDLDVFLESVDSPNPAGGAPPAELLLEDGDLGRRTAAQEAVAERWVAQAKRELARGDRRAAEAAFHRALSADRHHGPALIGLSELYFDRADYYRAMEYAARAVRVKPKDAGYHLALGDAYYRLLRFSEAKQHYTTSRRLGHPQARARLAKVARKLGTEP